MTRAQALTLIHTERDRQATLWNREHRHGHGDCSSPAVSTWVKLAVLTEEVGEANRALLDGNRTNFTVELVQVAAVALAILEAQPHPDDDDGPR